MNKNKKQINDFLDDWLRNTITQVFDEIWDDGKNECGHLGGDLFERFGITYRDVCDKKIWDSDFLNEVDKQFIKWDKTIKN